MKKLRIGIDVDGCVVRSDLHYMEWLLEVTGKTFHEKAEEDPSFRAPFDYGVHNYFEKELEELGIDGLDFWRRRDLYDNLEPDPAAKSVIDRLHAAGHAIIFVTRLKGDHHKSKCYFLKRHFPYLKGIVNTHEKGVLSGALDVMIDDRLDNLEQFDPTLTPTLILSPSPYDQKPGWDKSLNVDTTPYRMEFSEGWEYIGRILGVG